MRKSSLFGLVFVISTLVVGVLGYMGYLFMPTLLNTFSPGPTYQAVFLSNGQVYFGQLDKVSTFIGHNIILTHVYYLQAGETSKPLESSPTPSSEKTKTPSPTPSSPSTPELTLIKLGSELHAPEDKLVINRNTVLFWENLKEDGQVVQAIKNFKQE